jgi:hypothetical protein
MSHRFFLRPNYNLLLKHNYDFVSEEMFDKLISSMKEEGTQFESQADYDSMRAALANALANEPEPRGMYFDSDNINTEVERIRLEEGFRLIVNKYGIGKYYDTLLFITLVQYDHAWLNLDNIWDSQTSKIRAKELAQLLLLYNSTPTSRPVEIIFKTLTDTVKVKDGLLSSWIGNLVKEGFENGNFPIAGFGDDVTIMSTGTESPINLESNRLNIPRLRAAAATSTRSFKKDKRKYFTLFAYNLWLFLNDATPLKAAPDRKFSDEQFRFLFEVAVLFNWLDPNAMEASPADYMSSLFSNYLKRQIPDFH